MAERRVRLGIKVAQMIGTYEGIRDAWLEADRLGFDTCAGYFTHPRDSRARHWRHGSMAAADETK